MQIYLTNFFEKKNRYLKRERFFFICVMARDRSRERLGISQR